MSGANIPLTTGTRYRVEAQGVVSVLTVLGRAPDGRLRVHDEAAEAETLMSSVELVRTVRACGTLLESGAERPDGAADATRAIRAAREAVAQHAELLAGAVKLGDVRLEAQWRRALRESLMRYDGLRARQGLPTGTSNAAPGAEDAERNQRIADIAECGERRRAALRDRLAEAG